MTHPSDSPAATKSDSITAPLVLWLTIQLLTLSLAASRIPLSAHYPQPPEFLALQMMAIVQTIALAMLFPVLLRSRTGALAIALTAGPMLHLAGVLAQAPFARVMLVWLNVVLIVVALAVCGSESPRGGRMWMVAIANLLTLGSVIFAYLQAEFAGPLSLDATWFSPALAASSIAHDESLHPKQWTTVVAMCIASAVLARMKRNSNPAAK